MAEGDRVPPAYDPAAYYGAEDLPDPAALPAYWASQQMAAAYPEPAPIDAGEMLPSDYRSPEAGVLEIDAPGYWTGTTGASQPMPDVTSASMIAAPPPGAGSAPSAAKAGAAGSVSEAEPWVSGPARSPAAFRREMTSGKPTGQTPTRSGGAGGGDPFKGPNAAILASIQGEKQATERLGGAEAGKALAYSEGRAQLAREEQEEAAIQQEQARLQREELQAHLREADDMMAAVREKRVDPNQLMDEGHNRILAIVGGLVGGLYQGINRQSNNPFLDAMNKAIDRNIDAQEKNLRHQREGVSEKLNLISHLRTVFKDEELARIQARMLHIEGAKQMVEAEAARYDSPIVMAKTGVAMSQLDKLSADTQKLFAKEALARAQAAASAQAARQRAEWERYKEAYHLKTERMKVDVEGRKVDREVGDDMNKRFVATGQAAGEPGLPDGTPTGFVHRDAASAAKFEERQAARDELRAEINDALKIREDTGMVERGLWREGVGGLVTPEWQVRMRAKESALKQKMNKGSGLGAYDAGTAELLQGQIGKLDAVGTAPDERLREALAGLDRSEQADMARSGTQRAAKVVGPDGRERTVPLGGFNAPNNPRANSPVRREE